MTFSRKIIVAIVGKRVFDMMRDGVRCHRRVSTIQTISYACPKTKTVSYYDDDYSESISTEKKRDAHPFRRLGNPAVLVSDILERACAIATQSF
ncbi:hypothetical protein Y032_0005g2694 [Ancylostoma ceylanicum]|nr:hypothetical protein Y032_0005g2694 [Ancylostoma ceylanicum]